MGKLVWIFFMPILPHIFSFSYKLSSRSRNDKKTITESVPLVSGRLAHIWIFHSDFTLLGVY